MNKADEQLFQAYAARTRRHLRIAIVIFVVVAALPWVFWAIGSLPLLRAEQLAAGAGLLALVGVPVLALLAKGTRATIAVLLERPHEVGWAYGSTGNGAGLHLGLASGKKFLLSADIHRVRQFLAAVARIAPQATLGFEPAHEQAFRRSPESLRRSV